MTCCLLGTPWLLDSRACGRQLWLPAHDLHKTGSINVHEASLCPEELMWLMVVREGEVIFLSASNLPMV